MTRQPCPMRRQLAFFDPLLGRAPPVVEPYYRPTRQLEGCSAHGFAIWTGNRIGVAQKEADGRIVVASRLPVNPVDRFDEPFLVDVGDSLRVSPEESPEFLDTDLDEVNRREFPQAPRGASIYADDPIRIYLREMGLVPLLSRQGEMDLTRRIERGKLRAEKAMSRSPLVQQMVLSIYEAIRKNEIDLDWVVHLGDLEGDEAATNRCRAETRQQFTTIVNLHPRFQAMQQKLRSTPQRQVHVRARVNGKIARLKVELSQAIRAVPFYPSEWKDFSRALERATEEIVAFEKDHYCPANE
jgi:RNA polymerase primary sigma factor